MASIIPENPVVRERLFMAVKYITYGILAWNGLNFFLDENEASAVARADGLTFSELIEVYSATIDTTFWLLLVVLLELETYVIDDKVLKRPPVKFSMMGARAICYGMICYALYGYIVKTGIQSDYAVFAVANACDLVSQNFSLIIAMEDYIPLTMENCVPLNAGDLYRLGDANIVGPLETMEYARNVAWIDIFNASTWIAVVALLEVDVWHQLKGNFTGLLYKVSKYLKIVLYSILFACAVAWGYTGVLLDFADAVVWLFAFFFIELNLFQWQQETEEEAQAALAQAQNA